MKLLAVGFLILAFFAALSYGKEEPEGLLRRTPFKIPLARITVIFDEETRGYNRVRINFDESQSHTIIARGDDMFVRRTKHGGDTTVYRETPEKAHQLSDFEAKQISRACRTLTAALEEFEKALKNEEWGKCLYLDAYFPRFLRGFHVMINAARNSSDALPRSSLVLEDDYDVSINSPKSDARINMWRGDSENIMKLRIAAKELAHHTKEWRKKELDNSKRNPEYSHSTNFDRAFTSFVRNYFGYKPTDK